MRDIISQGELDYIRQQYPDKVVKMPSIRQQQILMMHLRGMVPKAIANGLGVESTSGITGYLKSDSCQAILDHLRTNEFNDVRASREYLTSLLFESYHKAGTSMEEIAAIREIGKLNGLYKSDDQAKNVTINQIGNIQNIKQLEKMTEAQLIEMVHQPITINQDAPKLPAYEEIEDAALSDKVRTV